MSPQNILLLIRLLLGLVLYIFLGSFLLALWRDSRRLQVEAYVPQDIQLVGMVGERFKLQGANLIGRAADNSILLTDDSVSAHHARLTYISGQWILEDLGSKNGTFVNDLPVDQALVVTDGDQIRFGAMRYLLGREASEPENEMGS